MSYRVRNILASIMLATTVACCAVPTGTLDLSSQIAYTEAGVQAIVRTCAKLLDEKRFTTEQGLVCDDKTKVAFSMIDVSRQAMGKGNLQTAESQLSAARAVLVELERYTGVK